MSARFGGAEREGGGKREAKRRKVQQKDRKAQGSGWRMNTSCGEPAARARGGTGDGP